MKKAFTIFAAITIIIFGWAILFKICHWGGGDAMTLIAFILTMIGAIWGGIVCNPKGACNKAFTAVASVAIMLLIWALIFRLGMWPGGWVLLFLGFLLMIPVSIWGGFLHGKDGKLGKAVSIFIGFVLAILACSLMFKIAHWPGGEIMLLLSLGVMIPVSSIWGCISYLKHNK